MMLISPCGHQLCPHCSVDLTQCAVADCQRRFPDAFQRRVEAMKRGHPPGLDTEQKNIVAQYGCQQCQLCGALVERIDGCPETECICGSRLFIFHSWKRDLRYNPWPLVLIMIIVLLVFLGR